MLRFRIALASMIAAFSTCFLVGVMPIAIEAIAHGGEPTFGFDGYGGLEDTIRQLRVGLFVSALLGSGTFIGAYLRNPMMLPRYPWLIGVAVSNIVLTIVFALAVEFALRSVDLLGGGRGRRAVEVGMSVVPSVIGTWFIFGIWERRVSASA